jgi:tetratricopeptide (TPR) repeat protein
MPRTQEPSLLDENELEEDLEDHDIDDLGSLDALLAETDLGWDIDAQVLTLKEAASATRGPAPAEKSPPPPRVAGGRPASKPPPPLPRRAQPPPLPATGARTSESIPARAPSDMSQQGALVDLLQARVARLEAGAREAASAEAPQRSDAVGLARAHMELAIASEMIAGDDGRAAVNAEAAAASEPAFAAAHAMLRRKKHARGALPAMLAHLESELSAATGEPARVELLAEKARLLDAQSESTGAVRAAWEQALAHAPNHAAALKGLESVLLARAIASDAAPDWEALSAHLGHMAEAYGSEPQLAAWLHVERAHILERNLQRVDAARGALEQALELDPSVGPVRNALVRHAAAHSDWGVLARLLDEEARIETSASRGARLELDAAMIAASRLADPTRACALLERAAARAPTAPAVDRRVLDELVHWHEKSARWADAARARRARLRFVTDPAVIAFELRTLAAAAEKEGDLDAAIADVQRALTVDATDPTLIETLDRLLALAGKEEQRVATWLQEAARTEDGPRRSRAFARAAQISEALGRRPDAIRYMRSAWVAAPGDADVLDPLASMLAPTLSEYADTGTRSLVELYAQAADHSRDRGRKVAYLERVAVLWEELLGDASRAARAYEQVLDLEPDRRSALLGLARTALRAGDAKALARALIDEARLAADVPTSLGLRTRASAALAPADPSRAMQLVRDVLEKDPSHTAARALETRLEEEAGRWEMVASSLRARIDLAPGKSEKVALWLALAQTQHVRLHRPLDAMRSLEQARALDPAHPVPPEEIARVLEDHGDARALRDAIERMASRATTAEERMLHLARVAEIEELRLGDDVAAMRTYQRALADFPEDEFIVERLSRVATRLGSQPSGALAELAALLAKRIESASPGAAAEASFELAALLVESGQEAGRAIALLESAIVESPEHVQALRTLESVRRRAGDWAPLARVLARQGEALKDVRARLGALWNLAALEEWKLPVGDPASTYRQILDLDPTDPGALEGTLRRELPNARRGDPRARRAVIGALRSLVAFASDDDTRLTLQLRLALVLESSAEEAPDAQASEDTAREAMQRYRDALRIDDLSVTAATGVARLAARLGDAEGALAAATSLAELADDPRTRARYLVEAGELLTGPAEDEHFGSRAERRHRAAAMLDRALDEDPDSGAAASRLAAVLHEEQRGERLVSSFRAALGRAKSVDAIVMLGSEIARVARDELQDLTVAIDAMRRVRAASPQHVPSLLTLAELCIAQRVWPEAVDALEAVVATSREPGPKLTALFALASIYEKVLSRDSDVDRVLRAALAVDAKNARALRALLRRIAAAPVDASEETQRARRREIADLLGRLSDVEKDPDQKTHLLLELADVYLRLGDGKASERALVEAVAVSPQNARAFARLTGSFRRADGTPDPMAYARALGAVIGFGQQLGAVDARWFAVLGQLEIQSLARPRDGIVHLQRAVALEPNLYETRFELASAFARMSAHDEATRVLTGMLSPSAHPLLSLANPAAALGLLEQSLSAERRPDEAIVVSELRNLAGQLDEGRCAWLRDRRLAPLDAAHGVLDRPTLVTHILPPEGRHILLEVAAAIAGIEAKMLRSDLSELGITPRDRITPRTGHPTRSLLDRVARQLGVGEIELAVATPVTRTRVLSQDVPWVVVPPSIVEQPEMTQVAILACAVARIAYGVPWLEELPPPQIEALLVAAARQVVPNYGEDDVDVLAAKLVAQYDGAVGRVLTRRQRKLLEELAPHIASPQSRPPSVDAFVTALARAELRAAFVVTGDLLTVVEEIRTGDATLHGASRSPGRHALSAVLEHPFAGDVTRFALTPEATALRRRLGSTWTG